jgi:hypothetical protein
MTGGGWVLPPGLTPRQFLEDVLDAMGDADRIYDLDERGDEVTVITRVEILDALAEMMDGQS